MRITLLDQSKLNLKITHMDLTKELEDLLKKYDASLFQKIKEQPDEELAIMLSEDNLMSDASMVFYRAQQELRASIQIRVKEMLK